MNTRSLGVDMRKRTRAALEIFNARLRHHRIEILPRQPAPLHGEDFLWTYHDTRFMDDPRFVRAYERAVRAGGFDYRIRWRVHTLLWAAQLGEKLDGAFVECGTAKGFTASAICEYLGWTDRRFYLYDTFEPARKERERTFYADGPAAVRENFNEWPGVELIVGKIPDTLLDTKPVAFLHIDLNDASAEEAAVRHFWPRLSRGAPMVFDDYVRVGYQEEGASADRLAAELGFTVVALPTGQGYAIKT